MPLTPLGGARIRPASATPSAGGNGGGSVSQASNPPGGELLRGSDDTTSEEENSSISSSQRRRSNSHDRRNGIKERKSSKSSLVGGMGPGGGVGGGLGNPLMARSERDLTKVTKVRVRSAGSARDLTQLDPGAAPPGGAKARPKMKTTTMIVSGDVPQGPIDVLHAPLDWRLVEQTRSSLQEASDNLIQLYKRISLDHSLDEGLRHRFLQDLVTSADVGQATLRPLTHQPYDSNTRGGSGLQQSFTPNKGPSWC